MVGRSMLDRILEGLKQLSDRRGSTARDLLAFVRRSYETPPRNLTMQVHRALKNGVADGSLRRICGRYRPTINPELFKQKGPPEEQKSAKPKGTRGNKVGSEKKLGDKKKLESISRNK